MTEEYTIGELEKKIGYQFRDKSLLKQALTHSSFANEQRINKLKDYERHRMPDRASGIRRTTVFIWKKERPTPFGFMRGRRSIRKGILRYRSQRTAESARRQRFPASMRRRKPGRNGTCMKQYWKPGRQSGTADLRSA